MTNSLRELKDITLYDIACTIEGALTEPLDADSIAEFVASIDWSTYDNADEEVVHVLGLLEGWTTEHSEGSLAPSQFRSLLEQLRLVI